MKKLLTVIISLFFLASASNADVISEYISNLIPGDGDTEVSIDLRENYSPDFSILMVRELSSDTNENTFTQTLTIYFIMFILFRLFDIIKPYPVSYYDKNFKNGFGVVMDDVCAGLYVVVILVLYMTIFS